MAGRRGGRLRAGPHCSHRHRLRQLHPCGQPRRGRADDGRWSGRPGRGDRSGGPGDRSLAQPSRSSSADRHADDLPHGELGPTRKLFDKYPAYQPAVATGTGGVSIVVWQWALVSDTSSREGIAARTVSATGELGPVVQLGGRCRLTYNPAVAISPEGDSVVVWLCDLPRDGENRQLIVSRVISADGTVGQLRVLGEDDAFPGTCGCPQVPQVATDADGDSIAAWQGADGHVQVRAISPTGVLGPTRNLTPGRSNEGADHLEHGLPELAMNADGTAIVAYCDEDVGIASAHRHVVDDPARPDPNRLRIGLRQLPRGCDRRRRRLNRQLAALRQVQADPGRPLSAARVFGPLRHSSRARPRGTPSSGCDRC